MEAERGALEPKYDNLWAACPEHLKVYSEPCVVSLDPTGGGAIVYNLLLLIT